MSSIAGTRSFVNTIIPKAPAPKETTPKESASKTPASAASIANVAAGAVGGKETSVPFYMQSFGLVDATAGQSTLVKVFSLLQETASHARALGRTVAASVSSALNTLSDAASQMGELVKANDKLTKEIGDKNSGLTKTLREQQGDLDKATDKFNTANGNYETWKNEVISLANAGKGPGDSDYDNAVAERDAWKVKADSAQLEVNAATQKRDATQGKIDAANKQIAANNTAYAATETALVQATGQLSAAIAGAIQSTAANQTIFDAQDQAVLDVLEESFASADDSRSDQLYDKTRQNILKRVGQKAAELADEIKAATSQSAPLPQGNLLGEGSDSRLKITI